MELKHGHLTYCTNIHAGETWSDHFRALREHIPVIKQAVSPGKPFGVGLRLSHIASVELGVPENLATFKKWLAENGCYVFTMNGFPYGGFHHTKVKDHVHQPDWTTQDRVIYTIQLFNILSALLPDNTEGGISTSPLSYKYWHDSDETPFIFQTATENIMKVVAALYRIRTRTGQTLHLDIEPEPDGMIESGEGFIDWYNHYLLAHGVEFLAHELGIEEREARKSIYTHVRLCYDVCHFAVGYEDHPTVLQKLRANKIQVGKIQISAALKAPMAIVPAERTEVIDAFKQFNESTYLHQVVAMQQGNEVQRYRDLPEALGDAQNTLTREWRSHFHVPIFIQDYGVLKSTQDDIVKVLSMQAEAPFTNHLEVETYTWEVLPPKLKLPISQSVIRELQWVMDTLEEHTI